MSRERREKTKQRESELVEMFLSPAEQASDDADTTQSQSLDVEADNQPGVSTLHSIPEQNFSSSTEPAAE